MNILDSIGIKIKVSDKSEVIEYMDYRYNAPWLVIQFRLIFKREKISQLLFNAQMVVLNEVLEQGNNLTFN